MSAHCNNASFTCGSCVTCDKFDPHYTCPANDQTYWAKRILGKLVPNDYIPDMSVAEILAWVDDYKKKYNI